MDERKSALVRFRFQLKEHQDSKNEWMDQLFGDRSVSSFGAAFACLLPWERGRNIPKILILFFLLGDLSIVAAMFTNYHRAHSRIVKDHRQGRLERKRKKERKKERKREGFAGSEGDTTLLFRYLSVNRFITQRILVRMMDDGWDGLYSMSHIHTYMS